MAEIKEALVPDIGDYSDIPVIEVLVAVGDTVKKDQGLVTLESDKATMEVPSAHAGVVKELKVKVGDNLSEGKVVALIEVAEGEAEPAAPAAKAAAPAPAAKVETAETAAVVEPVAVAAEPDKLAQREIAQSATPASTSTPVLRRCSSMPTRCCRPRCRTPRPRCVCSHANWAWTCRRSPARRRAAASPSPTCRSS
jgi:Pyruvate/2-oxoglutarate dehydrogenase complex, dihydrolipoamide acyltransferase (E2) component, and related enzymes